MLCLIFIWCRCARVCVCLLPLCVCMCVCSAQLIKTLLGLVMVVSLCGRRWQRGSLVLVCLGNYVKVSGAASSPLLPFCLPSSSLLLQLRPFKLSGAFVGIPSIISAAAAAVVVVVTSVASFICSLICFYFQLKVCACHLLLLPHSPSFSDSPGARLMKSIMTATVAAASHGN